ncbi:MAG TPA: dihydrofolate reductase family protein [Anaerolineales bacterium]|jgi:dihydrofolate reductase
MRKLIAGMKISVDGKVAGPGGFADWVETWSDGYEVTSRADTCLLGGGMYPGYELYWSAAQNEPYKPLPQTNRLPTPDEIKWAGFAANTPHYVLTRTLTSARWSQTRFLRSLDEIATLKRQSGKDIYLVGGARTTASLIDAGFVDELNLIIYPLIAGEGLALFAGAGRRRGLELQKAQQLKDGRVSLVYWSA